MASRFLHAVRLVIGKTCRRLWRCAAIAVGFHLLMSDPVIYGQTGGADVRIGQTAPGRWDSLRASIQAPKPRPQPHSAEPTSHSGVRAVQIRKTGPAANRVRPAGSARQGASGIGPVYSEWRRDNQTAAGMTHSADSASATHTVQPVRPPGISDSAAQIQTTAYQQISSTEPAPWPAGNGVLAQQQQQFHPQQRVFEPQSARHRALQPTPSSAQPIHIYPPGFATPKSENTLAAPRLKPIPPSAEAAIPLLAGAGDTPQHASGSGHVPALIQPQVPAASIPHGVHAGEQLSADSNNLNRSPGGWSLPNANPPHSGTPYSAMNSFDKPSENRSPPVHVYPEGVTLQSQSEPMRNSPQPAGPTATPRHVYPEHHAAAVESLHQEFAQRSVRMHSLPIETEESELVKPDPSLQQAPPVHAKPFGTGHSLISSPGTDRRVETREFLSLERYRPPTAILPASQRPDMKPTGDIRQASAETPVTDSEIFWWEQDLARQLLRGREPYTLTLPQALGLALTEAPELQILHSDWFIQQIEVTRRDGQFDWTTFVDSIWNRDSTPVGNNLDGAVNRLRNRSLNAAAGIRRLSRDGTELEVFQRFGLLSSNSQFINPNNQGTTRLGFSYEKPLMRGGGTEFNEGPVRLAQIDNDVAFDQFQIGIQDHLLAVSSAYWSLVLQRGLFLQAVNSWTRARQIADEMAGRIEIDVTPNMLDRARSEVAVRLAAAIQAEHDTVQAQDTLLRLIFGSRYTEVASHEVVTLTLPMAQADLVAPEPQIQTALHQRSEIHEAIRQIKAASLRYNLAANEVMPMLNLVLTGYVAGLERNSNLGQSFLNQFDRGEPGVGVGLNFEVPYRNRAAQAAAEQNLIAIKRMRAQLELTIGEVTEDVRGQVIQRNKYGAMLTQQWESLARAKRILKYAETRRSVLADGTAVADLYLENLLLMQNRLADAEQAYLRSQVLFSLADNALLRAISQLDSLAERDAQHSIAQGSLPTSEPQHFPAEQQFLNQQPMDPHSTQQPTLMIP